MQLHTQAPTHQHTRMHTHTTLSLLLYLHHAYHRRHLILLPVFFERFCDLHWPVCVYCTRWLILCVHLTGPQEAHIFGYPLFLGVSTRLFLDEIGSRTDELTQAEGAPRRGVLHAAC